MVAKRRFVVRDARTFWRKVNKHGAVPKHIRRIGKCWLWSGKTIPGRGNVGELTWKGGRARAPRVAWEIATGQPPGALYVCHACDNPQCVRPSHLFTGTHADNVRDCVKKGRHWSPGREKPECIARGERNGHAKLTASDVLKIRAAYASGNTTYSALARAFGVGMVTVANVIGRATWKHV